MAESSQTSRTSQTESPQHADICVEMRAVFLRFAIRNLARHKLRSSLAVVGIVIGVLAISSLGIFGNSIKLSFSEAFSAVGNELVVYPRSESMISEKILREVERAAGAGSDVIPLRQKYVRINDVRINGRVAFYGLRCEDIPLLVDIERGRAPKRSASECLIGAKLASDHDMKVGNRIHAETYELRITGILKERGIGFDINPDEAVIIDMKTFERMFNISKYNYLIVRVDSIENVEKVKESIEKRLNRREEKILVRDLRRLMKTFEEAFAKISVFLLGIGAISLVVAGVSILNVMTMSVVERTKEIGIMRAIGTSRIGVMCMFLYESLLLGLAGSAIGGVLSFGGGFLILSFWMQKTSYLLAPSSILCIIFGISFGIATSVLSGLYPAWRASMLNPIDALKYE